MEAWKKERLRLARQRSRIAHIVVLLELRSYTTAFLDFRTRRILKLAKKRVQERRPW